MGTACNVFVQLSFMKLWVFDWEFSVVCISLVSGLAALTLVLKSASRTEVHSVQSTRRKAWGAGARIMDAKRTFIKKFLKSFSHFMEHILQTQVR